MTCDHDVLLAVVVLVSVGPLLLLGAWSRVQLYNIPPRKMNQEALRIIVSNVSKRYASLIKAINDKSPQSVIDQKASEVYRYIRDNVRYL